MEILGIGSSEFVFIVLLAIIVIGPKNMKQAGRTIGRLLNRYVTSDAGKMVANVFKGVVNLPQQLMREANLEDFQKEADLMNVIASPADKRRPTSTTKAPHTRKPHAPKNSQNIDSVSQNSAKKTEKQADATKNE
ncbi:MAG TPA: hypothetical protein PKK96_05775 [Anaerolineales bacterium]|nr:hypothetical protein [Anaerolineales bacterium]HMR99730.1 hypothetical protein [Anaerolineales bacterium]HNQ93786.1 hypothetical protein [Anaerolineales bacterium]HNS60495.1 hypothetical protein [Anaerolineales bacterium]